MKGKSCNFWARSPSKSGSSQCQYLRVSYVQRHCGDYGIQGQVQSRPSIKTGFLSLVY